MALYTCKKCGKRVPTDYAVCPYCQTPQPAPEEYKKSVKKKKKHPIRNTILVVLGLLLIISAFGNSSEDKGKTSESNQAKSADYSQSEPLTTNKPLTIEEIDTSDYLQICSDVLFEYGGYMGGEKVVTVITVASIDAGMLKAKTDNNDSFFFSVCCYFDDKNTTNEVNINDKLTIAGTIEERNEFEDVIPILATPTASLRNCKIIGRGEIEPEIETEKENQRAIGEAAKTAYETAVAEQIKAERDDYIKQCESVKYSDVERNPDSYKGKKIKVSGKVIQVSEGLFDSVTLRVSNNGNVWYVTYTREDGESRILENDQITCYGECDGVHSYTSVLGSRVTIPSLKMKYYI